MNSILTGLISYDTVRKIHGVCSPDSEVNHDLHSQLSVREKSTYQKISKTLHSLCLSGGIDISRVSLRLNKEGSISCEGNSSKTVIRIGMDVLKGIVSREKKSATSFLQAYENAIRKFPDSPSQMEAFVQKKSDQFLHAYRGLHQKCHLMLTDDEIRFILAHEIKGHAMHDDNSAKLILFLTVALTTFVGLSVLMEDPRLVSMLTCSLIIAKLVSLPFSRKIEHSADFSALIGDAKASKGARLYFKRHLIAEKVQVELERREAGKKSFTGKVIDLVEEAVKLTHPSSEARLKHVLAIEAQEKS